MSNDIKVSSHTNSTFKANWPEKVAGVIVVFTTDLIEANVGLAAKI